MNTLLKLTLAAGLVALPFGPAQAQPRVQGLIEIGGGGYYDPPTVDIFTDDGVYRIGETVQITVTVDRPGFVTVYNIDAVGHVRRLTRDPRGAYVTPGRPLYLPEDPYARLVTTGPGGTEELIALVSPEPFGRDLLPFYLDRGACDLAPAGYERDGYVERLNVRLLGGCRPHTRGVARTTFRVVPVHPRPVIIPGGITIDIGIHIPLGARVYVDGSLRGRGPRALAGLAAGIHRITVHTEEGRKYTRTVQIGPDARHRVAVEAGNGKGNANGRGRSKNR